MQESSSFQLHNDKPIRKKSEDTLGRKDFAENIAKAIKNYPNGQDSLVLGLYGEWGSGKTSVINMIREGLEGDSSPIIIDFSPWYFSGQDQLFEQFFQQLAFGIRGSFDKMKDSTSEMVSVAGNVADKIIKFSTILRPIKHITPFVGIPSDLIDGGINAVQKVANHVKGISDAVDKTHTQKGFDPHELKSQIGDALSELDRKVLIIIDDIDRLTKDETRQIFQLVKALADFKNTVYLLSFDRVEVCAALRGIQTDNPEQYLEKIIQIPFELPILSTSKVFDHLTKKLDSTIVLDNWNDALGKHWNWLCHYGFKSYLTNLRDVARFLNICNFNYGLLKGEVNLVDLLVISAIGVKHPTLYNFIKNHKHVFCGANGDDFFGDREELDKKAKEIYQRFSESHPDTQAVEPILTHLFPYLDKVLTDSQWGSGLGKRDLEHFQRIAAPQYFDCFFHLTVPEGQIADQLIFGLIDLQDNTDLLLHSLNGFSYEQKKEVMDKFKTHIEKINAENYISFAAALMPLAENIDESDDEGFFAFKLSACVPAFIWSLFTKNEPPKNQTLQYCQELFSHNNSGVYMMSSILFKIMEFIEVRDNQGHFSRDMLQQSEFKSEYERLETLVLRRIEHLVQENKITSHHKMVDILYSWKRINDQQPISYVNQLIGTQEGLITFVTGLLGYAWNSDEGKVPRIHFTEVKEFVSDTDDFIARVTAIKNHDYFIKLPEKTQIAIKALLNKTEDDF